MAMRSDLLAVGSNSHILLMDPRMPRMLVRPIESLDGHQGIRSLSFQHDLITCGSGQGHVFFYDLRYDSAQTSMHTPPVPSTTLSAVAVVHFNLHKLGYDGKPQPLTLPPKPAFQF